MFRYLLYKFIPIIFDVTNTLTEEYMSSVYLESVFENEFWPHFSQELTDGLGKY